jgi:hypothetical protein
LRNPWRCHFDSARPEYFLCGDVGQNTIEEVDFIVPGGNYGWRKYEGIIHNIEKSLSCQRRVVFECYSTILTFETEGTRLNFPNDPPISNPIFPIMEYNHNGGAASVTGGITYRYEFLKLHLLFLFVDVRFTNIISLFQRNFRSVL